MEKNTNKLDKHSTKSYASFFFSASFLLGILWTMLAKNIEKISDNIIAPKLKVIMPKKMAFIMDLDIFLVIKFLLLSTSIYFITKHVSEKQTNN